MKILFWCYQALWTVAVLLSMPVLPFVRKGRLLARLFQDPRPGPEVGGVIWVHALSLGEVVSAVPLVRALGEGFPQRKIL
ncbi:MAG: hypothetical protein JRJ18_16550 [Deltaproteobacteria bacterium]|nr:hypothetical protein [Deltaproteobacteria bacterium]